MAAPGGGIPALAALLVALASSLSGAAAVSLPRGVDPAVGQPYAAAAASGSFACLDGSAVVPFHAINDDFCDCVDGSDEPGTSACPRGTFYCRNRGHTARALPSSFVNDGVCDCCDGSDEPKGRCPNECLESAKYHIQELERKLSHYSEGLQAREEYVKRAVEAKSAWAQRLGQLDAEIEGKQAVVAELRVKKTAIDAEEAEAQRQRQEARRAAEEARGAEGTEQDGAAGEAEPEAEVAAEAAKPEEAAEAEIPDEDLDPEELGRRIAARWTNDPDAAGAGSASGDVDDRAKYDQGEAAGYDGYAGHDYSLDYTPDYDFGEGEADYGGSRDDGGDYGEADYVDARDDGGDYGETDWDGDEPYDYEHERGFEDEGGDTGEEEGVGAEGEEDSENERIKNEFSKQERELRALEEERTKLTAKLGTDFGPDGVWAALDGKCVSSKVDKYTYEVCINGEARQKEGHSSVLLGKSGSAAYGPGALEFTGGQGCWQGPARSMRVRLECGAAEELAGVEEPSRCEYAALLRTPVVCTPEDMAAARAELAELTAFMNEAHDEL